MSEKLLDMAKYAQKARQMAAEGCVLLKNDGKALPLQKHENIAVFGRCALNYYKSGLGSGGLVNTSYVVSILDALKEESSIKLNVELLHIYEEWKLENPIDQGHGWGTVPWSQKEMPVTDNMLKIAEASDAAIVIIGRTAGEDQDNKAEAGSYLLTDTEKEMIAKVSKVCKRTIVLLNVGNIIDMKWVEECRPAAVLYVWQGGQEGGHGVVDVLMGRVNPCGKLTATIAKDITDYPSTSHFGDEIRNYYEEDIYVGYRYFETFAKNRVLYPFGYGMSYTQFVIEGKVQDITDADMIVKARVTNTGDVAGKEVVQIYVKAPQGKLGKPELVLAGFTKTKNLEPGESEEINVTCVKRDLASFDETGESARNEKTSKNCFVLEEGIYEVFVGNSVRNIISAGSWEQSYAIIEQCNEACAPLQAFERIRRKDTKQNKPESELELCLARTQSQDEKIEKFRKEEIPQTGNQGYLLRDVAEKKITMEEFVAQLSKEELIGLFHGEGMCSIKVTPGTAGAFGGVTDSLRSYGIPIACCADGPSGIRMDSGDLAFSLPNGTAIGSSFNKTLAEELFYFLGMELQKDKIDTILGPGINLQRNPLNGRNFEYCSEDPLLTGKMCVSQLNGLHTAGVSGTIKHFCGNNQEHHRTKIETVVSQRALRELYLKSFEIAVKDGNARSVMTSYNPINGFWAAGNYDICTIILREEWKFEGIVMTDWWAEANWEGKQTEKTNRAPMVMAQNDIFMVCSDASKELEEDNVLASLESGKITLSDLQRNAVNILTFILKTPAMKREMNQEEVVKVLNDDYGKDKEDQETKMERYLPDEGSANYSIDCMPIIAKKGKSVVFQLDDMILKPYEIQFEISSELSELAQLPVSLYFDNIYRTTLSFQGTNGVRKNISYQFGPMYGSTHYLKMHFAADGIEFHKISILLNKEE